MKLLSCSIVRYSGRSMWPLFQEDDLIETVPTSIEKIRRGDCVVYHSSSGRLAVHRVVANGNRLKTRGDALSNVDEGELTAERLVGKAVRRYRQGRMTPIKGGWVGVLTGFVLPLAGRIDPMRQARGGCIARRLRCLTIFSLNWLFPRGETKILILSDQRQVVVWYWGRWVVGRKYSQEETWEIYWPWRICLEKPPSS